MRLSNATLANVKADVEVPKYDRSQLKTGVVMFGLGNFARSHFAKYLHDLMQKGEALDWAITGVSLKGKSSRDNALAQDGLYTLIENPGLDNKATIVGSVRNVLFAPESPQAVIDTMAAAGTKIVAMAMTANGYYLDSHGKLMMDHADIQHDLTAAQPKTALGYIAHALRARRDVSLSGFTVQSLDNIVHNGDYTREAVMTFIKAWDPDLLSYAEQNTAFPNSMVDRIAPKTQAKHGVLATELTGLEDVNVIPTEPFTQWVSEDKYANGRPPFEKIGIQYVADVTPYEIMKLRLLNVSHLGIACLGDVAGLVGIDETMAEPVFKEFMKQLMDNETGPTVPPVEGVDLKAYKATLIERFANTAIDDTTQRVATDAPLQVLVDTIRERLSDNQSIDLLSLIAAAWLKRTRGGKNEKGGDIIVNHPLKADLARLGNEGAVNSDPMPQLSLTSLFGDLGQDERFVGPVAKYLKLLDEKGVLQTMESALNKGITSAPRVSGEAPAADLFGNAALDIKAAPAVGSTTPAAGSIPAKPRPPQQ